MPVKEWMQTFQPVQLYIVLILTTLFFLTELVVSHLTHALTLLMDSYHMLCNILALSGCIITIKYGNQVQQSDTEPVIEKLTNSEEEIILSNKTTVNNEKIQTSQTKQERKLRNTFGWTRIDVISMLICCVFLASFSFSIYVEALQTLTHIDHQDEMHHPMSVLCIGAAGLLLNGLCYLLIGGYTFHQGSFLYVTESGDVILNKVVVNDSVRKGERRLSRTKHIFSTPPKKRQGLWEMARDSIGCTLVIICAMIVLFTDPQVAKFVDPLISLISATCIMVLSYPYIKESCLILLQTIPDTIDIETMKKELINHFPDILDVHDFHIWQLTASKVISTVHIIFENPKIYQNIFEEIKEFFLENGITQVTIQPEFFQSTSVTNDPNWQRISSECLVACQGEYCKMNHCCPIYKELNKFKSTSKEIVSLTEPAKATLKSVKIIDNELAVVTNPLNTKDTKTTETNEKENNEIKKECLTDDEKTPGEQKQTKEENLSSTKTASVIASIENL